MEIEQAIYTELSAITSLESKIYPILAQQSTVAPYLTYEMNGKTRRRTLGTNNGLIESPYQIDIFHTSFANLKTLTALVVAEILSWEQSYIGGGTSIFVQNCTIEEQIESYDAETLLYQCTLDIHITY